MSTLLAFPLAQPLGGVLVFNVHEFPLGANQSLIVWTPITTAWDDSFVVAIDGKPYAITQDTSIVVQLEPSGSPIIQVIQVSGLTTDPGHFISGFFDAVLDNKIQITWDPPAVITDVVKYRIYWDDGTGTVVFDSVHLIGEQFEDGSASYEFWTDILTSGNYKFVVRVVDEAGNETTNVSAFSQSLITYPTPVSGEAIALIAGPRARITWTDSPDIGAGDTLIFTNGGSISNLFPDYSTSLATVAAGVETFDTAILADGIYVFGIRTDDGTNVEPNTSIILIMRLEAGLEIVGFPAVPILTAENKAGGTVEVQAMVMPIVRSGRARKVEFYTNDGAGGAVDYNTPLGGGFVNLKEKGEFYVAIFTTTGFGETARKFGCVSFTSTDVPSERAVEFTLTPDATAPPVALNVATAAGRD